MKYNLGTLLFVLLLVVSCGKKGPLKAPEDVLPGVKAGLTMADGAILLRGSPDAGVAAFKIERTQGVIGDKKEAQKKIIYEGKESGFSVKDSDIKAGEWYIYRVIPELKKGKTGKIFLSNLMNVYVIPQPPKNLSCEILQNKGSIVIRYEGAGCDEFRIFRYVEGVPKSEKPYTATKEAVFTDEFPLLNTELTYEVRCVARGMESGNNPAVKLKF